jgi:peptidoglycan/xylan/chitin deacetylase (PgdA/CDA1 family)
MPKPPNEEAMVPRRVTLTFDNGPTPGITERVLEALDNEGILGTFFVIGRNLADPVAASLARNAHSAGHWIGNHTFTHSVALGDRPDPDYAAYEIESAQRTISELSHPNKLFRPYGKSGLIGPHLLSRAAIAHLMTNRFQTVLWNNVPGDWKDQAGWVESCVAQVLENEWSVVVLHDVERGCLPRLPELLQRLNDLGVMYEQDFPESVILTRAGKTINILPTYVSD